MSPMANYKSGPDYSAFIKEYIFLQFDVPCKMYRVRTGLRLPWVEDHCSV
jgi:hypothetical protein